MWALVLALTLLAAGLRLFLIGAKTLWLDEAFSLWVARHPLPELWSWLVRIDQHPPLYYTLLHFWLVFGDSEATLRLPSTLLGTLTIPLMYGLGRTIGGHRLGLLAALLLAISPFHVQFGQETRMYALLTLAATLAMWGLAWLLRWPEAAARPLGDGWRAWRRARRTGAAFDRRMLASDAAWLAYMVGTGAALLSHNTAIFLLIAANLIALSWWWTQRANIPAVYHSACPLCPCAWPQDRLATGQAGGQARERNGVEQRISQGEILRRSAPRNDGGSGAGGFLRNWLLTQAVVLALWSIWLPAFVIQSLMVYREFWVPRPDIVQIVITFQTFYAAFIGPIPLLRPSLDLVVLGLAWLGLRSWWQDRRWLTFTLALWLVAPLGELVVSIWRPIFYVRTLVWTSIPLYLMIAAGVMQLQTQTPPLVIRGWRVSHRLALIVLLAINLGGLGNYYFGFQKEAWDRGAAYVARHAQPDDLLLFNASWVQLPFDYYFKRYNRPVAEHGVPADLFDRGLEPRMTADDLPRLRELAQAHRRVWLVYSHNWYTDPQGLIPSTLEHLGRLADRQQFNGLRVDLYEIDRP